MQTPGNDLEVNHPVWGKGRLVRIEGTDWIVSFSGLPTKIRIRAEDRRLLEIIQPQQIAGGSKPAISTPDRPSTSEPNPSAFSTTHRPSDPVELSTEKNVSSADATESNVGESTKSPSSQRLVELTGSGSTRRDLLKMRAIESLANGLPAGGEYGRSLAVGFNQTKSLIDSFLEDVAQTGGGATVIRGQYGQGKTFALRALEDVAFESGFLVAKTEVDATENQLNKPFHIFRDLMKNLRIPGQLQRGSNAFAREIFSRFPKSVLAMNVWDRFEWLKSQSGCEPISWLFSDANLLDKPKLLGLLAADPQCRISESRTVHCLQRSNRIWPAFTAGTQGDFASYVLSGISLLGKRLGFKGLILIMDEMEKWENLNWSAQIQAGNLLGGLIWGATNAGDRRRTYRYPGNLTHSNRCGGYPFSTERRCHLGLAIAMTPRNDGNSPEAAWHEYGTILDVNLPQLTVNSLKSYAKKLAVLYAEAYGFKPPEEVALAAITSDSIKLWQEGYERSTRSAVQSTIAALERWRDNLL
jgi:hypothetical protein